MLRANGASFEADFFAVLRKNPVSRAALFQALDRAGGATLLGNKSSPCLVLPMAATPPPICIFFNALLGCLFLFWLVKRSRVSEPSCSYTARSNERRERCVVGLLFVPLLFNACFLAVGPLLFFPCPFLLSGSRWSRPLRFSFHNNSTLAAFRVWRSFVSLLLRCACCHVLKSRFCCSLDFGIALPKKMDVQNGYSSPQKNLQPSQVALLIKQEAAENAAAAANAAANGNVLILPPMQSHLMQGLISSSKMLLHPVDNNMQHPQEFLTDPSYPFPPSAIAVMPHYQQVRIRAKCLVYLDWFHQTKRQWTDFVCHEGFLRQISRPLLTSPARPVPSSIYFFIGSRAQKKHQCTSRVKWLESKAACLFFVCAHIRLLGGFFCIRSVMEQKDRRDRDGNWANPHHRRDKIQPKCRVFSLAAAKRIFFIPAALCWWSFSPRVSSPMRLCARFVVPVTSLRALCALSAAACEEWCITGSRRRLRYCAAVAGLLCRAFQLSFNFTPANGFAHLWKCFRCAFGRMQWMILWPRGTGERVLSNNHLAFGALPAIVMSQTLDSWIKSDLILQRGV